MARMKVEVTPCGRKRKVCRHDRLVAYLPDYAPVAARFYQLANLLQAARRHIPVLSSLLEAVTGFTARRDLPNGLHTRSVMQRLAKRNQRTPVSQ